MGPEEREARKTRPPIDEVGLTADGFHLTELWQRRMSFYPSGRPDLLTRFVIDALRVQDQVEAGHLAVSSYRMEERLPLIRAKTLVLSGSEDRFASPHVDDFVNGFPAAGYESSKEVWSRWSISFRTEFASALIEFLTDE